MLAALACIATAIYFEARSESVEGQAAVAWVIYHRITSERYPDNACDVVTQDEHRRHRCQFSYMCDGLREDIHDVRAARRALLVAVATVTGILPDPTNGATHYHAISVRPWWSAELERTVRINNHVFYRSE